MPEITLAIILDIEGTITPITFVKDVLFPFARNHLSGFLASSEPELTRQEREELAKLEQVDPDDLDAIGSIALGLIDRDVKHTALKSLQGKIWRSGYEDGSLRAPMFEDVVSFFKQNSPIYIYSSGSIEAQKLLLRHTEFGDLTPYVRGYFDTTSGPKIERSSYENIAACIGAKRYLFGSDNPRELDAARSAGWDVSLFLRPGNPTVENSADYACVNGMAGFENHI